MWTGFIWLRTGCSGHCNDIRFPQKAGNLLTKRTSVIYDCVAWSEHKEGGFFGSVEVAVLRALVRNTYVHCKINNKMKRKKLILIVTFSHKCGILRHLQSCRITW